MARLLPHTVLYITCEFRLSY